MLKRKYFPKGNSLEFTEFTYCPKILSRNIPMYQLAIVSSFTLNVIAVANKIVARFPKLVKPKFDLFGQILS